MAHLLIIDDDEGTCELIGTAVAGQGHTFDAAPDGAKGWALAQKKRHDLIIVDRTLPGMSGLQFVGRVRRDPRLQKRRIIMCTGSDMSDEVTEAFKAGVNDYVLKPIDLDKFLAKIAKVLGQPGA